MGRDARKAGFTLIELMAVLFIAGLLAAAAVPTFQTIQKGKALTTGLRQISAAVDFARQYAITRRRNTRFVIVTDDNDFTSPALREHADKVYCAYAVCTVDAFGKVLEYIRPWEYLPKGVVIDKTASFTNSTPVAMPFPSADSKNFVWVQSFEFTPTGAPPAGTEEKTLVLARGTVMVERDEDGRPTGKFDYTVTDRSVVWKITVNAVTGRVRADEVVSSP